MKRMTPAECAAKANVSLSLIYHVLRDGRLRAMRIGCRGRGCWRVAPEDFDNWLATCKVSEVRQEEEGEFTYL